MTVGIHTGMEQLMCVPVAMQAECSSHRFDRLSTAVCNSAQVVAGCWETCQVTKLVHNRNSRKGNAIQVNDDEQLIDVPPCYP